MDDETSTLVKYCKPTLFGPCMGPEEEELKKAAQPLIRVRDNLLRSCTGIAGYLAKLESGTTIEDLLNILIIPRYFIKDEKIWAQRPVTFPATARDVVSLAEGLQHALAQQDAKRYGVCEVRHQLYMHSLDEIIRQVVIGYKARGILLACVRDYYTTLFAQLRELYVSSTTSIVRKNIHNFQRKKKLLGEIAELKARNEALEETVAEIEATIAQKKRDFSTRQEEFKQVSAEKRAAAFAQWEKLRLELNS